VGAAFREVNHIFRKLSLEKGVHGYWQGGVGSCIATQVWYQLAADAHKLEGQPSPDGIPLVVVVTATDTGTAVVMAAFEDAPPAAHEIGR
jgi:hypothetical protein